MSEVRITFKVKSPGGYAVDIEIDSTRETFEADLVSLNTWLSSHNYTPQFTPRPGGYGSGSKPKQKGIVTINPESSLLEFTIPWRGFGSNDKDERLEIHKKYQASILDAITTETKVKPSSANREIDGKKEYYYIMGGGVNVYRAALELLPEDDYERTPELMTFIGDAEPHWTETQDWKAFWMAIKGLGLTEQEVHDIAGVASIKDYPGQKSELWGCLQLAAKDKAK